MTSEVSCAKQPQHIHVPVKVMYAGQPVDYGEFMLNAGRFWKCSTCTSENFSVVQRCERCGMKESQSAATKTCEKEESLSKSAAATKTSAKQKSLSKPVADATKISAKSNSSSKSAGMTKAGA
eukprot:77750_1